MNPLELFLRYAYSCGVVQRDELHQITNEQLDSIKEMIARPQTYNDAFVRECFPQAFDRMQRMMRLEDITDATEEDIDLYFLFAHNKAIDEKDGNYGRLPPSVCNYCRARVVYVEEKEHLGGNDWYTLQPYDDKDERKELPNVVSAELEPNAEPGDLIVIHQAVAVKKITEEYYLQLKQRWNEQYG